MHVYLLTPAQVFLRCVAANRADFTLALTRYIDWQLVQQERAMQVGGWAAHASHDRQLQLTYNK